MLPNLAGQSTSVQSVVRGNRQPQQSRLDLPADWRTRQGSGDTSYEQSPEAGRSTLDIRHPTYDRK